MRPRKPRGRPRKRQKATKIAAAATELDAKARWIVIANEFRTDLVDVARRMDEALAHAKSTDSDQNKASYEFEWSNMVSRIEAHLADTERLGSDHHKPHEDLIVGALTSLRRNCKEAHRPKEVCNFSSFPRSACLVEGRSIPACLDP